MPLQALVYHPRLRSRNLDAFRSEHDPFADLLLEHVTLVFPVPVDLETMRTHARSITSVSPPFDIHVGGMARTWDHWLYLEIGEGREGLMALHDRLYTGPLREHLRTDLPYEPHVGIGFFGRGPYDPLNPQTVEPESETYQEAKEEADELEIEVVRHVDALTVIRLDRDEGSLENVGEIPLGG